MRKGETLAEEAARKREEAERPYRLGALRERLRKLKATVRAMTKSARVRNGCNAGGERNGRLGDSE
jgi:hypothetical protein